MSQAEDLLATLSATANGDTSSEGHIVIDSDRRVTVPDELKRLAVQHDHNIETVTFDCPRYWDEHDMSTMKVYINYLRSDSKHAAYPAGTPTIDEDDPSIIHFDWVVSRNVTQAVGTLTFLVCIKNIDSDGNEVNHWNSELCTSCYISKGLETEDEAANEYYSDIVTQWYNWILGKIDAGDFTGPQGFSPIITVEDINGGYNLTIEDINGTKSVTLRDTIVNGDDAANVLLNSYVYISDTEPTYGPKLWFDTSDVTSAVLDDALEGDSLAYGDNFVTFVSESGEFELSATKTWDGTMYYSTNGEDLIEWDGSAISSVSGRIYLAGFDNTTLCKAYFTLSAPAGCYGNLNALLNWLEPPTELPSASCYSFLFYGCEYLTHAPELPATTLTSYCYQSMFQACTSLTSTHELPATTLADYCYLNMFANCSSLTAPPELPATTLPDYCYHGMFQGCSSIKLSDIQTSDYTKAYMIPSAYTDGVTPGTYALTNMFTGTSGTFTGTPSINTTYYLYVDDATTKATNSIAGLYETDGDILNYSWYDLTATYLLDGGVIHVSDDGELTTNYTSDGNSSSEYLSGDLILSNAVTTIGTNGLADCYNLTSITIPTTVISIGTLAFNGCTNLSSINYDGTIAQWGAIVLRGTWNNGIPATEVTCSDGTVTL